MNKTKVLLIWFLLLNLLLTINVATSDRTIDANIHYIIGNETYLVNDTTRTFSQIRWTNNYIVFNNTGINVTSSNPITIYIDYINSSILEAGNGDLVFEFCADTASGNVGFSFNGFRESYRYRVKRNGSVIANPASDMNGEIIFTNDVWSKKSFEIYQLNEIWYNTIPTIEYPVPANNSISIDVQPTVSVWVNDSDGNMSTVDFYNSTDGINWIHQQTNLSVLNETVSFVYSEANGYLSDYYWMVTAYDGNDNVSSWFKFTTGGNPAVDDPPFVYSPYPGNGSAGVDLQVTCRISVIDYEGDEMVLRFYENSSGSWMLRQTNTDVDNGTYNWKYNNANIYSKKYYWRVSVFDSSNYTNKTYYFTTLAYVPSGETDGAGGVADETTADEQPFVIPVEFIIFGGVIIVVLIAGFAMTSIQKKEYYEGKKNK